MSSIGSIRQRLVEYGTKATDAPISFSFDHNNNSQSSEA